MKEKFITFPQDHQLPSKDELRGKVYYKYHNSLNHSTNYYRSFSNVILGRVNKEVMVNFLGEKEVMVKFFGKKEVTVKFSGEKEVTINFSREKEVTMKALRGKEVMVIDEDLFSQTISINIVATDSRAILNTKKAGRFSPSVRVRKVWILKQYLTYKNDLVAKGRVPAAREWKKNEGIHTIHLKTQNKRQRTRSLRKRTCFSKGKGHE